METDRDALVRKAVAGLALLLAAPLSVVSWVLVPTSMVEGTTFVSELASTDTGQAWVSMVTGVLFFPVVILGVLGLLHLQTGRERLLGTVGAGVAIVGLTLNVVALGAAGTLAEAVYTDVDPTVVAGLVEDTMSGVTGGLGLIGVALGTIGMTLLGISLYRARALPRLWALMLVLYGPVQFVGFGAEVVALITLSYVVMALATIPVGIHFLREPLDEWRHPATFQDPIRFSGGEPDPLSVPARVVSPPGT